MKALYYLGELPCFVLVHIQYIPANEAPSSEQKLRLLYLEQGVIDIQVNLVKSEWRRETLTKLCKEEMVMQGPGFIHGRAVVIAILGREAAGRP